MTNPIKYIKEHQLPELLQTSKIQVIDVRSPKEFLEDHLTGAINLPVLNDKEYHEVGKEYVQVSKLNAKRRGAAIVSRNIASHLENQSIFENYETPFLMMCLRGGQRSFSFAHVLSEIGYHTYLLEGGYKRYRHMVQDKINKSIEAEGIAVYGLSGSGKTDLLNSLSKSTGLPFLDLEKAACHRGSRYGGLGLAPVNQKIFESRLWHFLNTHHNSSHILLEGESRMIGKCVIPKALYDHMSATTKIWINLPLEQRAKNLVSNYFGEQPSAEVVEEFLEITQSLKKEKGKNFIKKIEQLILSENFFEAACILLENLFDPLYAKCRKQDLRKVIEISASSNEELKTKLSETIKEIQSSFPLV